MPKYGKRSLANRAQAHPDLQKLCDRVVEIIDNTVVYGQRTPEVQWELFKIGRSVKPGRDGDVADDWEITGDVVTYKDGYEKLSRHNYDPSLAVDLMPYPIPKDKLELHRQMGQVVGVAKAVYYQMKKDGELDCEITFGADWITFRDYPHIQRNYD